MFVDLNRPPWVIIYNMSRKTVRSEKKAYPAATHGSRVAARGRKKASKLSNAQREEYFRRGMVLIYGSGLPKKTVAGY